MSKPLTYYHILLIMLIISSLFFSCKDDNDETIPSGSTHQTLIFEPNQLKWQVRLDRDSVFKVKISNGKPPYYILASSAFAADSYISNDTLFVTAKDQGNFINSLELGYDFINIADNAGNVNILPINVNPDYFTYRFVAESSLIVSGDTTVSLFKPEQLFSTNMSWDQLSESAFITINNPALSPTITSFNLSIRELTKENTKVPEYNFFRIELSDTTSQPVKRVEFIADSTTSISIIEASATRISLDFKDVTLVNKDNAFNGSALLNGKLVIESEL